MIEGELAAQRQDQENKDNPAVRAFQKHGIREVYYHNKCDNGPWATVHAYLNRNTITYTYSTLQEAKVVSGLDPGNGSFIIYKKMGKWEKSEFLIDFNYNNGKCPGSETISAEEVKDIAARLPKFLEISSLKGNDKVMKLLYKKLEHLLSNPFYKNVKLAVNVKAYPNDYEYIIANSFENIRRIKEQNNRITTLKYQAFEGTPDIVIDITIDKNGKPVIQNKVDTNYLKEFEGQWEKEAKKRGLKADIPSLRKQVKTDLENLAKEAAELSFYKKFVQKAKALVSDNIADYVEAIAATQKIAKNVWKEGTVNKSTWHTKEEDHKQWPGYCRFEPTVAGVEDGIIDEIVGIPMAIKGVYEIATDDEKQKALMGMFTKDAMANLYEGLQQEGKDTYNDEEKGKHFVGQTTVSVVSMMAGVGLLTKSKKLVDGVENITETAQTLTNPKTIRAIEELKKETKYLPEDENAVPDFLENRKSTKEFLEKTEAEILDELGEDLSKILGKGEDLTVLQKARNLPGVSSGKGKQGNAGLFPKSVADKLNGKKFPNFDEFRKEFWKVVADDLNLSKQFPPKDIFLMKNGLAPEVLETQRLGGQIKYILHHKTPIRKGGAVYDMDNLMIVTPKFHKEILAPSYHYGYGY